MEIIDKDVSSIIDLALTSEITDWAYYNCTQKAKQELVKRIRDKLYTFTIKDKQEVKE